MTIHFIQYILSATWAEKCIIFSSHDDDWSRRALQQQLKLYGAHLFESVMGRLAYMEPCSQPCDLLALHSIKVCSVRCRYICHRFSHVTNDRYPMKMEMCKIRVIIWVMTDFRSNAPGHWAESERCASLRPALTPLSPITSHESSGSIWSG